MSSVEQRIASLRTILEREGLDGWYINGTDPHQSEYVSERWKSRAWISGFTGSAGSVLVTMTEALLWVDSRYFIQGAQQIEGTCLKLMKLDTEGVKDPQSWMATELPETSRVGIDGSTLAVTLKAEMDAAFKQRGIALVACPDYLEKIWTDRPMIPPTTVVDLPNEIAGFSRIQKLTMTRLAMVQKGCNYTLVSSLDDIAWITNLRSSDVSVHSPVFLSFLLIGTEKAWLFTDPKRFSKEIREALVEEYEILPYEDAKTTIESLLTEEDTLYYDPKKLNLTLYEATLKAKHVEGRDFTTDLKACKNETELEGMRRSHLLDGVALVNFLARLDTEKGVYDEIGVSTLLRKQRERDKACIGASFSPISGWGEHGAICHYSATKESSSRIEGDGLLVLDTGGMYEFGLTDITRTILFGKATDEQKRDYTLVLKGNLALASARFPEGTCGYQLDILARQFLWQQGLTFFHGTGHGLGFRLNVHEGPAVINTRAIDVPLKRGMIISDEPGIYREGRHGIRIENILTVREDIKTEFGQFFSFEVLTICPFERKLIEKTLLTESELSMVNTYHRWVYEELKTLVDEEAKAYLKQATLPL
ncbi:MAG TPA: aminopeptidase P family protein [Sphaerochaeta sp.]|nr:aminopeptidase P family protein [Sphaerochaeta sp.]